VTVVRHRPVDEDQICLAIDAEGSPDQRNEVAFIPVAMCPICDSSAKAFAALDVIQRMAFSGGIASPRGAPRPRPWPPPH